MTVSKFHWKASLLLLPYTILGFVGMLNCCLVIKTLKPGDEFFGWFIAGWSSGAFGITYLLKLLIDTKKIIIKNACITIIYPLIRKKIEYQTCDILYHKHSSDYMVRYGNYKSFFFTTKDSKTFWFSDIEIINYNEIVLSLTKFGITNEIDKWPRNRRDIRILIASVILSLFVYGTIYALIKK